MAEIGFILRFFLEFFGKNESFYRTENGKYQKDRLLIENQYVYTT